MQCLSFCFITNYLTHHQLPFCLEMAKETNNSFTFIETDQLPSEREKMGYENLGSQYSFVKQAITKQEIKAAKEIVDRADVVMIGSAPNWYISNRLNHGQLTFRSTERIFKKKNNDIPRLIKYTATNFPYRNKSLYYLFCSAYGPADYKRCGADCEKFYKWGYFPQTQKYDDISRVIEWKHPASILWAGRLIEWKHPEIAVLVAEQLRDTHIEFTMKIIGDGALYGSISNLIKNKNLEDRVEMLGSKNPEEVRKHMEESQVFLFTSDQNEGWGAVVNEAMNSGCAVITSKAAGAVPYLITEKYNGLIVDPTDLENFSVATMKLLEDSKFRNEIGINAYYTIVNSWNAEIAANRFISLCNSIIDGIETPFSKGICSKAEITFI